MIDWLKNAVFYEIYPQTFADSNGDGIGDLPGIADRLDYVRELGCNALWLNPCYESPFLDAGYDIADHKQVAARYGTNADLRRLIDEAHRRGLHVLLDLVITHTSWLHPWFLASKRQEKNEFSGRYVWTDSAGKGLENVGSLNGFLRGLSDRDGCVGVNYYAHQPSLNYGFYEIDDPSWQQPMDSPDALATREAAKDIMRFWLKQGCDGFRVDMAGTPVKNDPRQEGTIELYHDFRRFLDEEFPQAAMISEWGQPDRSLKAGFHMDFMLQFGESHYEDLFHAPKPFFSRQGQGDARPFVDRYEECYEATNRTGLICIPSGNHDTPRLSRYLDAAEAKLVFAFLMSMPGAPFIYYGDEIGMKYLGDIPSVEGGYERTGSRTPMQWDDGLNAGFSAAKPEALYTPLDPDPRRPTVQSQKADPGSLYNEVKKLIALRQAHPALQSEGQVEFVHCRAKSYPLAYRRTAGRESILVALNPSGREAAFPYGQPLGETLYQNGGALKQEGGRIVVPPASAAFVRV